MLTPFGKELRKLRIENDWKLKDMAAGIGVSPSFLSAVETGDKPIPADLPARIASWARLSKESTENLQQAAVLSAKTISMRMPQEFGIRDREAISVLARIIDERNIEEWERIRTQILKRG